MNNPHWFSPVVGVLAAFLLSASATAQGLVKEKPAKGRFVKTDAGFMIPYKVKIPATEVSFEMVPIPGGEFRFGSPKSEKGHRQDEGPQVTVRVEPMWMGKHEISWAEYMEFMALYEIFKEFETRGIRKVTAENDADAITAPTELYEPSFTFDKGEDPRQPAVTMTQYAAKQYTKWLSAVTGHQYRLPGEAEWEYACRAGKSTAYHFGDSPQRLGEYAWFKENSKETTHFIGLKKPNAWGLHDMHGNVAEWVLDEYTSQGYARLAGKKVTASQALFWPTKLYPRIVRGGSWSDPAERCRSSAKMGSHDEDWKSEDPNFPLSPWWFTTDPSRGVGFRIVRPLRKVSAKEMEKYWRADVAEVRDDVQNRLEEGRGAIGLVDETLPKAIESLKKK